MMLVARNCGYDLAVQRPAGKLFRIDTVQLRGVVGSGVRDGDRPVSPQGRQHTMDKGLTRLIRRRGRIWLTLAISAWLIVLAVPSANVAAGRGGGLAQPAGLIESPGIP